MSPSFVRTTGTIELILQPKHGVAGGELLTVFSFAVSLLDF